MMATVSLSSAQKEDGEAKIKALKEEIDAKKRIISFTPKWDWLSTKTDRYNKANHIKQLAEKEYEYELLLEQGSDEEGNKVPFYGEQATTYLRNNLKQSDKARVKRVSDTQPKDFANAGSGLFVGRTEQNNAEKQ